MLERTRGMKGLLCGLAACAGMTLSAGAMAGTIFVADGQDSRNGNLYVVEPSSGQVFSIASLDKPIHAMAYDSTRTTLYALTNNHRIGGNDQLITIDPATGATTVLASNVNSRMTGLAVADNGDLIGLHQGNSIYRINPTTGGLTYLNNVSGRRGLANKPGGELYKTNGSSLGRIYGGTNFPSDTWIGGMDGRADTIKDMAYDVDTDRLYGIDFRRQAGPSYLVEIDTASGQVTKLGDLGENIIAIAVGQDADVDSDGMNDYWETANGLNVGIDDTLLDGDNDGLNNLAEYNAGSNPSNPDTDGDGLEDGAEVNQYGTSPTKVDSDGDGTADGVEVTNGTDPAVDNDQFAVVASHDFDQFPDTVVDNQGNVHMVWYDDYDGILYQMLDAGGNTLIDATQITSVSGGWPSIAVTSDNHIYVVYHDDQWDQEEVTFVHLDPSAVPHNGAAANPASLVVDGPVRVTADDDEESSHVRLAVDHNNKAHLVWQDDLAGSASQETVRYMKLDRDGSVLVADREIIPCDDSYRCAEPDIAVGANGNVHIVAATGPNDHYSDAEIYYVMIDAATGNTLIDSTELTDANSRDMRARLATISLAPDNMFNIVWQESSTNNDGASATLSMMRIDPSKAAQDGTAGDRAEMVTMQTVFQTAVISRHPFARTDANGNIHLTYQDGFDQPGDITDAHYMVLDANADVLLDREITTPNADWWTLVKVSVNARHIAVPTANNGIEIYKTRAFGPAVDPTAAADLSFIDQAIAAGGDVFGSNDSDVGGLDITGLLMMVSGLLVVRRRRKLH